MLSLTSILYRWKGLQLKLIMFIDRTQHNHMSLRDQNTYIALTDNEGNFALVLSRDNDILTWKIQSKITNYIKYSLTKYKTKHN